MNEPDDGLVYKPGGRMAVARVVLLVPVVLVVQGVLA